MNFLWRSCLCRFGMAELREGSEAFEEEEGLINPRRRSSEMPLGAHRFGLNSKADCKVVHAWGRWSPSCFGWRQALLASTSTWEQQGHYAGKP